MESIKVKTLEFIGVVAVLFALGLITGAAFMASVLAGMFTLAGLLLLTGITLLYVAALREAKALENGQHTAGRLRSAA